MNSTIRVQQADFSIEHEIAVLRSVAGDVGAVVTFSGLVRGEEAGRAISALFLEHYPGMTESSLRTIAEQANLRWDLLGIVIIHRIGELKPGEQIVFVGVASAHRKFAFEACEFLMDYLKTQAPFWKKCLLPDGSHWIAAKESDAVAGQRW